MSCPVCGRSAYTDVCPDCELRRANFRPSRIALYLHCPGARMMTYGLESVPTAYAARGSLLHRAVLDMEAYRELEESDRELVTYARRWLYTIFGTSAEKLEHEVPLVLRDAAGKILTWGRCDFARNGIIAELKFGHEVHTDALAYQVLVYGAAAATRDRPAEVHAYHVPSGRSFRAQINWGKREEILREVQELDRRTKSGTLRLNPRPYTCLGHYCDALTICPAVRYIAMKPPEPPLAALPTSAVAALAVSAKIAEKYAQAILQELRARLIRGDEDPRWTLSRRPGTRRIPDPIGLWHAVSQAVPFENILAYCKLSPNILASFPEPIKEIAAKYVVTGPDITVLRLRGKGATNDRGNRKVEPPK